jgi:hypothetical protein
MKAQKQMFAPILDGFVPLAATWSGADAPLFPNEASARWFLRDNKLELIDSEALAYHTGRVFVHRERFEQVVRRVAIESAKRRAAP